MVTTSPRFILMDSITQFLMSGWSPNSYTSFDLHSPWWRTSLIEIPRPLQCLQAQWKRHLVGSNRLSKCMWLASVLPLAKRMACAGSIYRGCPGAGSQSLSAYCFSLVRCPGVMSSNIVTHTFNASLYGGITPAPFKAS